MKQVTIMNKITTNLSAWGIIILISVFAVLIFTTPTWYIWNNIVAGKFDLPTLTFSEAFWILLMIRFILPNATVKQTKD